MLAVHDDPRVRTDIERALGEESDLELVFASGAGEARARLDESEVDVIVSACALCDGDGVALMEHVRDAFHNTVRILVGERGAPDEVARAFNNGLVSRFVLEPWDSDEVFLAAVRWAASAAQALRETERLFEEFRGLKSQLERMERTLTQSIVALRQDMTIQHDRALVRRVLTGTIPAVSADSGSRG